MVFFYLGAKIKTIVCNTKQQISQDKRQKYNKLKSHLPTSRFNTRFGPDGIRPISSILRVVSYILMIPIAASVMETLASYSKIYTSPYPWPIWFKVVALLIAIPAGIIIETINKLDTIRNHLEILQSGNPQIRRMSAESLRQYESHSKYTIPALIEALNDKEETVVKEATESLKKLSGKDLGQDQEKWLEWWTEKQG